MKQLYIFLLCFFTLVLVSGKVKAQLTVDIDPSFDIGTGAIGLNVSVHSIALQPDGKILAGGDFTTFNGTTQNRLVRLNSDGSLDTSFNIGTGFNYGVTSITLQPDGKILVGGYLTTFNGATQNRLVRLNSDGTLDTSFNIGIGFNEYVISVTLQPDGKILVGGLFKKYNGTTQNRITRLQEIGCEIIPPTPEVVFAPMICSDIPEDMGTLIVTYPLGDEYEYSIGGGVYQSSPVFSTMWDFPITVTVRQGCCISDPLEIEITDIEENAMPTADVSQPDCSDIPEDNGDFGNITVTFPLGDEFQYSIDGENYQDSPNFFNIPPGNYELTFRVFEYCVSDPLDITIFSYVADTPTVVLTQPDCDTPYGSITVTSPFMDYPPYTYSINGVDYQFSPVFENLPTGTYYVTAQLYEVGCPSEPLEVNIHFQPTVPDTPTVTVIQPDCYNPYGSIEVTSPIDEGNELIPSYEYSINGVDYYEHTIFDNLSSGTYYITVRHLLSGCISDSLQVILFFEDIPNPTVDVIQPDCNNPYGSIEVTSPENYLVTEFPYLSWQYQYSINGTDYQEDVLFENVSGGTYYVTVKRADCISEPLEVILKDKEDLVCFIPKGISPNGDSLNDEFDLSDFGVVPSVRIFNRYGKEVYSQKDYTNQWKGQSSNGNDLPTGTYYYMILFQNGEQKSGWVYLNR